jgi:hypothetical protein
MSFLVQLSNAPRKWDGLPRQVTALTSSFRYNNELLLSTIINITEYPITYSYNGYEQWTASHSSSP